MAGEDVMEDMVGAALEAFRDAHREMTVHFGTQSIPDMVQAVLKGIRAREGRTGKGLEYFVHGVGYTVTLADGGDVHLDATQSGGQCFKEYDICQYLETAGRLTKCDPALTRAELERRADQGALKRLPKRAYELPAA